MSVLVLGGTAEARRLAADLEAAGIAVVSSLAGRVARPAVPAGETRVGGFGGVDGLVAWLDDRDVRAVVDATHPFAATISANAVAATARAGVPLVRLDRPGWGGRPDADAWTWVDDTDAAARATADLDGPVLLTTGRQGVEAFTGPLADRLVVVRVVDPPEQRLPDGWTVLQDRGPYTVPGESALLREHGVRVLVTKDSGGDHTAAKLEAAALADVAVVVVRRPPRPEPAPATVSTVPQALAWTLAQLAG